MAQTNTWTLTQGRFKDVRDVLFEIEGTENKFQDLAQIVQAKDHTHIWVSEAYSTGTTNTSMKVEGATLTGESPLSKSEFSNLTEVNAVTYDVTDRMKAIAKAGGVAGVKDQIKQSLKEAMLELKARVERSVLNGVKSAGDATHYDKMQGLVPMAASVGVTAYSADTAYGTAAEAAFRSFLSGIRAVGGLRTKGKIALMSYVTKDSFMGFKGIATSVDGFAKDQTIWADVKTYSSQYGDISLMGHDAMVDKTIVVFEKDYAKIAVLQPTAPVDLARTGLSQPLAYSCENTQAYCKPTTLGYMVIS